MPAPYNETSPNNRYLYLKLARAAIAAMREPTEAMLKAGTLAYETPGKGFLIGAWQAMIDAAMKDDEV
jgi:hypothetical protein